MHRILSRIPVLQRDWLERWGQRDASFNPALKHRATENLLHCFLEGYYPNYAPLVLASERRKIIAHGVSHGIRQMGQSAQEGRQPRRNNLSPMRISFPLPGLAALHDVNPRLAPWVMIWRSSGATQ